MDYREEIHKMCKEHLGQDYSHIKINSQIDRFIKEEKWDTKDIYECLWYWYNVRGEKDAAKANGGIGIVPHIYSEAKKYWNRKREIEKTLKGKNLKDFIGKTKKVKYEVEPIRKPRGWIDIN